MKSTFEIRIEQNNTGLLLAELNEQIGVALEECGMMAETFASRELTQQLRKSPPSWYKRTGTLRNSITHTVDVDKKEMVVGTAVEYAPYVELGTGIYVAGGRKTPWGYVGSDGNFHLTRGMPPRPFIKPSIENHLADYEKVIRARLSK